MTKRHQSILAHLEEKMLRKIEILNVLFNSMVDAWQRGLITGRDFFSFDGAGLRVDTIGVAFVVLNWNVFTIFVIALGQVKTEQRFTGQFLFDFFEASSAIDFGFDGVAASVGHFFAGGRVNAPGVTGRRMVLFGFVVTIGGASGGVETGGAFATTSFDKFSVARAFVYHLTNQGTSILNGGNSAVDGFLTGAGARSFDLLAGVFVDAPALASGAPGLAGVEKTIFIAYRNVVAYNSGWAQSFGTFNMADRAFRIAGIGIVNWFASVGNDAPAFANGSVTLNGFVETVFGALW